MIKIAVVYFTKTDVTGQLVKSAVKGIENTGAEAFAYAIQGTQIVEGRFVDEDIFKTISECDGVIFASPTYMGGVAAQFKAFADATGGIWSQQLWSGKVAAGITCGAGLNGDQSGTLSYFMTFASQHGMCWLGLDIAHGITHRDLNRLGCSTGVVAHSSGGQVNDDDLATAEYLGARVAKMANATKIL